MCELEIRQKRMLIFKHLIFVHFIVFAVHFVVANIAGVIVTISASIQAFAFATLVESLFVRARVMLRVGHSVHVRLVCHTRGTSRTRSGHGCYLGHNRIISRLFRLGYLLQQSFEAFLFQCFTFRK